MHSRCRRSTRLKRPLTRRAVGGHPVAGGRIWRPKVGGHPPAGGRIWRPKVGGPPPRWWRHLTAATATASHRAPGQRFRRPSGTAESSFYRRRRARGYAGRTTPARRAPTPAASSHRPRRSSSAGDHGPSASSTSRRPTYWWQIFRCPSVADFARPPRLSGRGCDLEYADLGLGKLHA